VRHRLPEPERPVDRAGDGDIVALLGASRLARIARKKVFEGR